MLDGQHAIEEAMSMFPLCIAVLSCLMLFSLCSSCTDAQLSESEMQERICEGNRGTYSLKNPLVFPTNISAL